MATKTIQTDLSTYLVDRADERAKKYKQELILTWPLLSTVETMTYLGAFSWTMPYTHQRLIYQPTVIYPFGFPQTPGEVVRDYLDWKYPKRLRCTTEQYHRIMRHRSFPRMAERGPIENATYLDLKSAYWSIVSAVGWNVDYNPGRWIGVSSDVWDFPLQDNKPARSALVTAGLSCPVRVWRNGLLSWKTAQNVHINYGLWALVQDVLHGVADDMRIAGAKYIHTDGYIVPDNCIGDAMNVIDDWGFKFSVKASGYAEIKAIGVYKVGKKKTKRLTALPVQDHVHIEPEEKEWLKKTFSFWIQKARKGG